MQLDYSYKIDTTLILKIKESSFGKGWNMNMNA